MHLAGVKVYQVTCVCVGQWSLRMIKLSDFRDEKPSALFLTLLRNEVLFIFTCDNNLHVITIAIMSCPGYTHPFRKSFMWFNK